MNNKLVFFMAALACSGLVAVGANDINTPSVPIPISAQSESVGYKTMTAADYNLRGIYYARQSAYELAKQDFIKAISLEQDKKQRNTYENNLAMTYNRLGQYGQALDMIEPVLMNDPNLTSALDTKGDILINLHRYDEAESCLTYAILLEPNTETTYYTRGRAYEHMGKTEKAIQDYKVAVQLPGDYQKEAAERIEVLLRNHK